jgi:hypothetical protein
MTKKVDKDHNYMHEMWGTSYLAGDYGWEENVRSKKCFVRLQMMT